MTNGGQAGTNGGLFGLPARTCWALFGAFVAMGLLRNAVNASSVIDELERLGRRIEAWQPWTWELTSLAGWIAMLPAIAWAVARIRPPRFGWPVTALLHLGVTVPVSLGHVAVMLGLRHAVYGMQGLRYGIDGSPSAVLLYEYRKDLADYLLIALLMVVAERLLARSAEPSATVVGPSTRIEVRDGSRTCWLPVEELQRVEAAGNYVELHMATGAHLHRATLAAMEAELAPHGFVRVHRSRLVRRDLVRAVETTPSGDFEVTLEGGAKVSGSRRYRDQLR